MGNKNLIGICGKAASGKTTLANDLRDSLGYEVVSFAKPLKEIATKILGRNIDKSKDRLFLINLGAFLKGYSPRLAYPEKIAMYIDDVLPDLDTNDIYFKENIWARLLIDSLEPDKKYVIDDLRFMVEYATLKGSGFTICYIESTYHTCENRLINRDGGFHKELWETASEKEHQKFPLYDIIVSGDGTKEQTLASFMRQFERLS